MIRSVFLYSLIVLASAAPAQYWERTGGPGGDVMLGGGMGPNGQLIVLSHSMHRSADNGTNWRRVAPDVQFLYPHFPKLVWSKTGSIFMLINNKLLKSTNDGDSWEQKLTLSNPGLACSPNGYIVAVSQDSIFISSNDGATWSTTRPATSASISGIGAAVDMDGVIYVNANDNYLYRSTNNGASWVKILNGLPVNSTKKYVYSPRPGMVIATIDHTLYVSTDSGRVWSSVYQPKSSGRITHVCAMNEDTLFLIDEYGIIDRSTDGGFTWMTYSERLYGRSIYEPTGLFANSEDLFVLTYETFYKQHLRDTSWQPLVVPNGYARGLCIGSSGSIFATTSVLLTKNSSQVWNYTIDTWTDAGTPAGTTITNLAIDSNEVLLAIIDGKFKKSTNEAKTWINSIAIPGTSYDIALTKQMIFVASNNDGVFRSSDRGTTWDQLNSGISDLRIGAIGASDNFVYAGGTQKYYRSTDNGWTWTEPPFPFIFGSGVVRAIDALGPNVIFGVDLTGTYFSSDYGLTWENHSTGLALDTIFSVLATPSGTVFAGTSSGAYEYDRVTTTWKNVDDDMLTGVITSLALGKDGRVYAGTNGDGVYRTTKTYLTRGVKRDSYSPDDISIYPNPASTEVQIHFNAVSPEHYRVAICDLLGETKQVIDDEATIDISTLRTGQYFLRIITRDEIRTLPLSIVR